MMEPSGRAWLSSLRRLARGRRSRNVGWLSLSYAASKPLWFAFLTAGCMRLLPPEGYGVFTTSLALAMVVSVASDFGTGELTTKALARRPDLASRVFTNVLLGRSSLALASVGVALGIAGAMGYAVEHLAAVAAAGLYVMLFRGAEYCRAVFRAFERLDHEAAFTSVEKVLVVGGGMAALVAFGTPTAAFLGMSGGMAFAFAASVWWIDRRLAPVRLRLWRPRYFATLLREATPLGLIALFSAAPLHGAQVLVAAGLGAEAAGLYGAAQRTLEALMLLGTIASVAVFARLSALFHEGRHAEHRRLTRLALAVTGALAVGVAAAVSLAADPVIRLLAGGEQYDASGRVLAVLAWAFPPMCVAALLLIVLVSVDRQAYAAWATGAGAALSLALTYVLLPSLGLLAPVAGLGALFVSLALAHLWVYFKVLPASPAGAPACR